jgi:hypothetical protein
MLAKKVQGAGGVGGAAGSGYLLACVGSFYDDMVTIDVSNPASMSGVFALGGFENPSLVNPDPADSVAIVTDADNVSPFDYVKSVDISDPLNTSILDSFQPPVFNIYADTDVVNKVYYSAQGSNSFLAVDYSNPSSLSTLYWSYGVTAPYNGQNVRADPVNDIVIVISGGGSPTNGAFFVIDVSTPSSPSVVGSLLVSGENFWGLALDTANKIAYVSSQITDKLFKISYSTPSSPSVVSSATSTYFDTRNIAYNASQGVLYLSSNTNYFSAISTSLVRLDSVTIGTTAWFLGLDIDETAEVAYVGTGVGLTSVDISDPNNLSVISTYAGTGYYPPTKPRLI